MVRASGICLEGPGFNPQSGHLFCLTSQALLDRSKAVIGFDELVLLLVSVIDVSAVVVGVISVIVAVLGDAWALVGMGHLS